MRRGLLLACALLATGCGSTSRLAPVDPPAALTEFEPQVTVQREWERGVGAGADQHYLKLRPLVDGARVYAAGRRGEVAAFDAKSGDPLWEVSLDAIISAGPGDGGNLVLLGGDAYVIALDKESGAEKWRAPVSSEVLATPVRAGGLVLAHTVDGNLFALGLFDGAERWRFNQPVPTLSLRGVGKPAAAGPLVFAGFANGRLAALDLERGRQAWSVQVEEPRGRTELERMVDVDADMVVAGGAVFVASYNGKVAAVTQSAGQVVWTRDIGSYTGIALGDTTLFISDRRGDLWALAARTGETLWRQTALHGRALTAPVIQGQYLVVGDFEGYLHWLHRDDGHLVARERVDGTPLIAAAEVTGGRLFAYDTGGNLAAFSVAER